MSRPTERRPFRSSLQARLAATYGGTFLVLGLLVLAIPYVFGRGTAASVAVPAGVGANVQLRRAIVAAQRSADFHQQLVLSMVALVVVLALSVVLGWVLAERSLRPLRDISAAAQEISARNLHHRLAITGTYDELTDLGNTLDDLLSRLEASFASQRNFVSNASHELRTPLTAQKTLLQVALADPTPSVGSLRCVCEDLLELGADQERIIDDLLTLAQSEGGVQVLERFDLAAVARKAVRARSDQATARGVTVEASCVPAPVFGDRRLVSILVGNLVDNAIRHNITGGSATVRTSHNGRGATVAVSNSGPVITTEDVAHLCEPFSRTSGGRRRGSDGHGIGLAIVRAVADAHSAELRIRARMQGGLAVDVTFPPPLEREPEAWPEPLRERQEPDGSTTQPVISSAASAPRPRGAPRLPDPR